MSLVPTIRPSQRPPDPSQDRVVWAYPLLCFNKFQPLLLPTGATILSAANVGGELRIYVEANPHDDRMEQYEFIALGTGHPAEIGAFSFINTVLFPFTPTFTEVYHVYYRRLDV